MLSLATHTHARIATQHNTDADMANTLATHTHARIATWAGNVTSTVRFWQPTLTRELRLQKKRKMCGDERTEILLKTGQQSLLGGQALKSVPSSFTAAAFQKKRRKWQLGTCPVPLRRCANRLTFPCMLVLRT